MFAPKSLVEFLKEEEDQTSWLLKGFWKKGGYLLISGPPKLSRKSFLSERFGLCIAALKQDGEITPMKQGVVLNVNEEGPKIDAQDRLRAQCKSLGIDPAEVGDRFFIMHLSGFRLFLPEHMQSILDWCDQHHPIAIILDPWSKVGPDDADSTEASQVCMQAVAELQRRGISVCIVCHTKKLQSGVKLDIDQEVRGSSVLTGAYDTHIALRPVTEGLPIPMTVRNKNASQVEMQVKWAMKTEYSADRQEDYLVWTAPEWKMK